LRLLLLYRIFVLAIKLMRPLDLCSVATQMETTETTVTREQLQSAVILCGEQERDVEIIQLSLNLYPEDWQNKATLWCQQTIQQIQQNAVVLDGLLEQMDEGKSINQLLIPTTPDLYNRLVTLDTLGAEKFKEPENMFIVALRIGNATMVDLLLQDSRVDPSVNSNLAIQKASEYGHLSVVERLLQDSRVDPSASNNWAIGYASLNNHLAIVERLLQDPRVDPSMNHNAVIVYASRNGHLSVVERLLQDNRVDPSDYTNYAIRCASKNGHLAVVNRLLQDPRVDPSDYSNYAIKGAIEKGHHAVAERLLQDPRVKSTYKPE
jgi:surface antigen